MTAATIQPTQNIFSLISFQSLSNTTESIVKFATDLFNDKQNLNKIEWKELTSLIGWAKSKITSYVKIGEALNGISPIKFSNIEPKLLFSLTGSKKYFSVINKIKQSVATVTQSFVESEMKAIRDAAKLNKVEEKPSIWRQRGSTRACVIPPIYQDNGFIGTYIQKALDAGESVQNYLTRAIKVLEFGNTLDKIVEEVEEVEEEIVYPTEVDIKYEVISEVVVEVETISLEMPVVEKTQELYEAVLRCGNYLEICNIVDELDKADRDALWKLFSLEDKKSIKEMKVKHNLAFKIAAEQVEQELVHIQNQHKVFASGVEVKYIGGNEKLQNEYQDKQLVINRVVGGRQADCEVFQDGELVAYTSWFFLGKDGDKLELQII